MFASVGKRTAMSISKLGPQRYRIRVMVKGQKHDEVFTGPRSGALARQDAIRRELAEKAKKGACPTVSGFWRDFRGRCERKSLAPSTMQGYSQVFRADIEPTFGHMRLDEVTPADVSAWLGGMTAGKARHCKAVMSAMFSFAEELGLVDHSVMRRRYTMPTATGRDRDDMLMSWDEMMAVADACQGEPWEVYFLTMAFAGLRREEAAGLKPSDISEHRGCVTVNVGRTVQRVGGEVVVGPCKTDASRRTALMMARGERLLELRDMAIAEGREWMTGGSEPANPNNVSVAWKRWFASQPFAGIPMRNLRNSFTTAMVAKGYDAAMVSRLTGHVSMDVTYRHYLRPTADDFIDAFAMDLPSDGPEDLPRGDGHTA